MAWGALAGGAAALGGGLISSAAQFGMNYAGALLSAKEQRSLRRTAYQDTMHSMKEAGLNPILAYGGTPGAGMGSVTMAPAPDPISEASKLWSASQQRELNEAQATSAEANAREAQAKADTAEYLRDAQKLALEQQARASGAGAMLSEERAETESDLRDPRMRRELAAGARDREIAETERKLREARDRAYRASAARDSASANEIDRRQPEYVFGDDMGSTYRGAEKLTELSGEVLDLVPGLRTLVDEVGELVRAGRRANVRRRRRREARSSARQVEPFYNEDRVIAEPYLED